MVNFRNMKIKFILFCWSLILLLSPAVLLAVDEPTPTDDTMTGILKTVGDSGGYKTEEVGVYSMSQIIGNIINTAFGLLGVIFIVLTIYAGYNWMTASGDESKVEKAQETLKKAIVGLIITVGSYAIWNLILSSGVL